MDMVDAVCNQVDDLLGRVDNACLLHSRRIVTETVNDGLEAVSYTHLDVYKRQAGLYGKIPERQQYAVLRGRQH